MEPDIERAWLEEAERRYGEFREGKVLSIPAEDAFARARARIAGMHGKRDSGGC
jgi:hypothetical protein